MLLKEIMLDCCNLGYPYFNFQTVRLTLHNGSPLTQPEPPTVFCSGKKPAEMVGPKTWSLRVRDLPATQLDFLGYFGVLVENSKFVPKDVPYNCQSNWRSCRQNVCSRKLPKDAFKSKWKPLGFSRFSTVPPTSKMGRSGAILTLQVLKLRIGSSHI